MMNVLSLARRTVGARQLGLGALAALALSLGGCADREHQVIISVPEQRMVLLKNGLPMAVYPVSTSKFGLGDRPGANGTPLGELEIARKIGDGAPLGEKFKDRQPTGEIVVVDAPGRDPIVTRILWLRGREEQNANAFERYIYIHGTPEERNLGRPASFGCVRMRSRDVVALYNEVGTGALVFIRNAPLAQAASPYLAKGATVPPPALSGALALQPPAPEAVDARATTAPPRAAAPIAPFLVPVTRP